MNASRRLPGSKHQKHKPKNDTEGEIFDRVASNAAQNLSSRPPKKHKSTGKTQKAAREASDDEHSGAEQSTVTERSRYDISPMVVVHHLKESKNKFDGYKSTSRTER